MPNPPLVPEEQDEPLAQAWKVIQTLVSQAQQTGCLKIVKTLRLCDGNPDDFMPPTDAMCPWMRLAPVTCPMKIGSESEWEVDFRISYEIAVRGTRATDLINLCMRLVKALSQSIETPIGNVQVLYRAKGIRVIEVLDAAIGPAFARTTQPGLPTTPPPPFMKAQGIIRGQVFFNN